jgi:hypothetical protein
MSIFTRTRRRTAPSPAPARGSELDQLTSAIAHSQVRLLIIAHRVANGEARPGDETRLRLQREIITSYRARLDRIALPTGTGDDAEAWLRSITPA